MVLFQSNRANPTAIGNMLCTYGIRTLLQPLARFRQCPSSSSYQVAFPSLSALVQRRFTDKSVVIRDFYGDPDLALFSAPILEDCKPGGRNRLVSRGLFLLTLGSNDVQANHLHFRGRYVSCVIIIFLRSRRNRSHG